MTEKWKQIFGDGFGRVPEYLERILEGGLLRKNEELDLFQGLVDVR